MHEHVIERGIPIPPHAPRIAVYDGIFDVLLQMEVGDSVWTYREPKAMFALVHRAFRKHEQKPKFTTRQEVRDGVKGTRIWRVV